MTFRRPPLPGKDLGAWARQMYEYMSSQSPVQGSVDPTPLLLAHLTDGQVARAATDGVLLFDPVAGEVVVSIGGAFETLGPTTLPDITAAGIAMITAADAAAQTALLDTFTSLLKGLVPASGSDAQLYLRADGTWASSGPRLQTAVVAASQPTIDFPSIPTWVNRITVMFNSLSSNGTSPFQIQIGDSGGIENTGYDSASFHYHSGTGTGSTTGFVTSQGQTEAQIQRGFVTLNRVTGNTWASGGVLLSAAGNVTQSAGIKTLSATLDRVRVTAVNGTDTFDAGIVSVSWE